ncbi:PilZ domain-containing protein [Novosphingobium sp. G106]|uniref:PilZ domain-containing protein n=1 Tax=Novosphingobium sp. G106 TaxID=2849500 RepID=UPI001C2D61AF|nr:PilZ domain-containing protein [Novosphingobium sp. G106]MBV1686501.1 PilZ domain-containing protein [Novosphingobium sp. G106]
MASSRLGSTDGFMLAGRMRDRRGQSRGRLGRVVQVAHEGDAAYARCHDFSDTGMKLDLTTPLVLNDEVSVALSPSVVLFGRVAWINGDECGIAFDGPVNSAALLDAADGARSAAQARATLDYLNGRQGAVSAAPQQGSQNRSAVKFEPGLAVTVMVGPDHEQRAVLRWAQGNIAQLDLAPIDVSRARGAYPALPVPEAN